MKQKTALKSKKISEILNHGIQLRGRYLNLYYGTFEENEVAFLVNKSIRGAVRRNSVRRRVREAWRLCKKEVTENVSICLMAQESAEKSKFTELLEDLKKLIRRI